MKKILETDRLYLRQIEEGDFDDLASMLQDTKVMTAWEHGFSDEEVNHWIRHVVTKYIDPGYGYFLAVNKKTEETVGQIGLLNEALPKGTALGVAYMLKHNQWGKGYAAEGALACLGYGFSHLNAGEIVATIRPGNLESANVARRIGMVKTDTYVKYYNGKDMVHHIYTITKEQFHRHSQKDSSL